MNRFYIKVLIKRLAKMLLGTFMLPWAKMGGRGAIRILAYHKVNNEKLNQLSVTVANFFQQMEYLSRNHYVISLADAVAILRAGKEIPNKAVVITFDDGYRDAFRYALPILKSFGFPATFFVTTGYVGSNLGFLHDASFQNFDNAVMGWNEINELEQSGMTVGAHTKTHRILMNLEEAILQDEIQGSKSILEQSLSQKVSFFAYPSGTRADFDDECSRLVNKAGFQAACSTINGVNYPGTNLFVLKRTTVLNEDSFFIFKCMMCGSLDLMAIKDSRIGHIMVKFMRKVLG